MNRTFNVNRTVNMNRTSPFILMAIFLVGLVALSAGVFYNTQETVGPYVVTGQERIVERNGEATTSKWLVYTEEEVFENTDSLWALKFNSADFRARMKEGQSCTFRVYGWRVPFLSMYRNIIESTCSAL